MESGKFTCQCIGLHGISAWVTKEELFQFNYSMSNVIEQSTDQIIGISIYKNWETFENVNSICSVIISIFLFFLVGAFKKYVRVFDTPEVTKIVLQVLQNFMVSNLTIWPSEQNQKDFSFFSA